MEVGILAKSGVLVDDLNLFFSLNSVNLLTVNTLYNYFKKSHICVSNRIVCIWANRIFAYQIVLYERNENSYTSF